MVWEGQDKWDVLQRSWLMEMTSAFSAASSCCSSGVVWFNLRLVLHLEADFPAWFMLPFLSCSVCELRSSTQEC